MARALDENMTPDQLLHHNDTGTLWPEHLQSALAAHVAQAYQTALATRRLRVARGEVPRGFKIGFTNRNIWPLYQVFGPIWGTVYASTLTRCDGRAQLSLATCCQPRLEPEAVFGIRRTPPPGASVETLFDCIEWVAPGFEIVQSHAPGWKFTAAMTVADGGLHAHLVVGQPVAMPDIATSAHDFNHIMAACRVGLHQNGTLVEQGLGANVLDSPLLALHHFLGELRQCPGAPDLQPGDVVTTGTWTDAWAVQPGQTWRADFAAPLGSLAVTFN
jgi:2-oxo-3-hexenedioate decarboxylase